MSTPQITVIGTGYVGLIQAVGLADFGNTVTGVDIRADIVERLSAGEPTIFEHGLTEYLQRNLAARRLRFTADVPSALADADIVFIAVGTPEREDGSADLSQIASVISSLREHATGTTVVVTKSTVPVGTNRWIAEELGSGNGEAIFAVVSNPEFLREGKAIHDFFHPDRVVVGLESGEGGAAAHARALLEAIYRPLYLLSTPFVWTTWETAELIKYASNAFLATKITFINQMANLAEAVGADISTIARTMGMDGRISPKFLHPGPGFGGSCFPKDTAALAHMGQRHGVEMTLVGAVVEGNKAQQTRTAQKILAVLGDRAGGDTVAVLGLAFKAETDDIRESPALRIVRTLVEAGVRVRVHDPKALQTFRDWVEHSLGENAAASITYCNSWQDAATGARVVAILTEWNEYRNLPVQELPQITASPAAIVDARNLLEPQMVKAAGLGYLGTGRA